MRNVEKNKNEIEGLFLKPINASIGDMKKFEEKEMTKKRPLAKITWYDCYVWLINYVLEPIVGGVIDKTMRIFKTNTNKDYSKPKRVNNVYGRGKKPRKPKTA